uniref:Cystathionine gamma-lyase n=1 Tax=Rhodosorus marinus TaxID=101924 RepID=A0A7S0BFJ2_9RHOD|mmetsp:Transcript_13052/g.18786  ORF Transcript_13052/g.18786 Transcript_13052/m.18786 type:complete len:126 (+) Transcript_13052:750-1127(+)
MAFVGSGDHILMTDGAYYPSKQFSERVLKEKYGVQLTYYPPDISARDFAGLIQTNTKAVYVETPTSNSFVLSDLAMIVQSAHEVRMDGVEGGQSILENSELQWNYDGNLSETLSDFETRRRQEQL